MHMPKITSAICLVWQNDWEINDDGVAPKQLPVFQ